MNNITQDMYTFYINNKNKKTKNKKRTTQLLKELLKELRGI
jgi:hypothetical protein